MGGLVSNTATPSLSHHCKFAEVIWLLEGVHSFLSTLMNTLLSGGLQMPVLLTSTLYLAIGRFPD